tara:strand:+ start:9303 stop:10160 length:858 start_codon:yes stop_codon:yes gene_type:complete
MYASDLITTRKNEFLNEADVFKKAPAVFNTEKFSQTSSRYNVFKTVDVIEALSDNGFGITDAKQVRARRVDQHRFKQHVVRFTRLDQDLTASDRSEIVLYNSGDANSALKFYSGNFRMVCSNNLVDGTGEKHVLHHTQSVEAFKNLLKRVFENHYRTSEQVTHLKNIALDSGQVLEMGFQFAKNRWELLDHNNPKVGQFFDHNTVKTLIKPTRNEDCSNDAYTVINRIQENLLKNRMPVFTQTVNRETQEFNLLQRRFSRPITNIKDDLRINANLWRQGTEIAFS